MKRKICVVITARPSYARVRTALEAIRDHPDLELQLVVGGLASPVDVQNAGDDSRRLFVAERAGQR